MNRRRFLPYLIISALLFALTGASCSSSKKITIREREEREVIQEIVSHQRLSRDQKKILAEARTWLGTPYSYAKEEKGVGTDCSGFVMKVYESATGEKLPRNSARQAEYCRPVKKKDLQPGDLVFFATGKDPKRVSHVGIMIDGEQFVHASSSKGVVISRLAGSYYPPRLLGFGRVPRD